MAFATQSLRAFTCNQQRSSAASRRQVAVTVRCSARHGQQNPAKSAAAGVAGLAAAILLAAQPAGAELNKFEERISGEFNVGTARQFGEADIKGQDFSGQDLQRSNFTSADCRDCNFKNAKLQASYFIKSVVPRANFENADLSDALMDRAVIVDANLRNAVLQRVVLTRSDLARSDIYGADFTGALLDKTQQMALCKYADGVNPVTGVSTRKSLSCGNSRRFKATQPTDPDGPQVSQDEKQAFNKSVPSYRE